MNKNHALFVRALKAGSDFRVKRLYQKIYYHEFKDEYLMGVLLGIVKEYNLMKTNDWVDGLNPSNGWMYGVPDTASYCERCVKLMSSFIRLAPISKFKDYPVPAFWRNK